jgi:hypothetical protein
LCRNTRKTEDGTSTPFSKCSSSLISQWRRILPNR